MLSKHALNLLHSSCLCISNAGIIGLNHSLSVGSYGLPDLKESTWSFPGAIRGPDCA